MTPERFARAQALFARACELAGPAREALLHAECQGDGEMLELLHRMLGADSATHNGLDMGPGSDEVFAAIRSIAGADDHTPAIPEHIGRYRVVRVIASGGMGVVYEAEQESPRRRVAVKVMRAGLGTRQAQRRFEYESAMMARLHHPSIAQVFEAGWTEGPGAPGAQRMPFFAMEYIENGVALTEAAAADRLSIRERIGVFAQACEGVHQGHQRGIVHRDLKPNNILLTPGPDRRVKIIDFGVARFTQPEEAGATLRTEAGQVIGTIQYMSPEQVSGASADLDARSDVYSLGVVLFELLAGVLPYDVKGTTIAGAARVITERPPARLSSLDRSLRGDLETIVSKAMEKDRERRYQSASELAADLRRYLSNEPIQARPPTLVYTLRKAADRNKPATIAAGVALLAILGGVAASLWWAVAAGRASEASQRQAYRASLSAAGAALREDLVEEAIGHLSDAPEALRGWEWRFLASQLDDSTTQIRTEPLRNGQVRFGPEGTIAAVLDGLDTRHVRVWNEATGSVIHDERADSPRRVRLTPDGARALRILENGTVVEFDVRTGNVRRRVVIEGLVDTVLSAPESPELVVRGARGAATLVDSLGTTRPLPMGMARTDEPHRWTDEEAALDLSAIFIPRGSPQDVFRRQPDGSYRLDRMAIGDDVRGVAFEPRGTRFVTVSSNGVLRFFDRATLELTGRGSVPVGGSHLECVEWSPDGASLAVGSATGAIRILDSEGSTVASLRGHTRSILSLCFSADGSRLGAIDASGRISIFRRPACGRWGGEGRGVLGRHTGAAERVVLGPGRDAAHPEAISLGTDGRIRFWSVPEGLPLREVSTLPGAPLCAPFALSLSSDGRLLMSGASYPGADIPDRLPPFFLNIYERATMKLLASYRSRTPEERFESAVLSPDGTWVAAAWYPVGEDGVRLLRLSASTMDDPRPIQRIPVASPPDLGGLMSVSPDGAFLAVPSAGHHLTLIETRDWTVARTLLLPSRASTSAWSPLPVTQSPPSVGRSARLAVGTDDLHVRVYDTATWTQVRDMEGHIGQLRSLVVSPDGSRVFSGSVDGTIKTWALDTGSEAGTLRGNAGYVTGLAISPDGTTLVSSSEDGSVRLWQAPENAQLHRLGE